MPDRENRKFPRISAAIEVRYQCGTELFAEQTMDLSLKGLYIVTDHPLGIGSPLSVSFTLPGFEHDFRINGRVVRNRLKEAPEGPHGMGVEFLDLGKEDERVLLQFVVQSQLTQKGY
jgi:uncharacterized protein (TIGR02266 family)